MELLGGNTFTIPHAYMTNDLLASVQARGEQLAFNLFWNLKSAENDMLGVTGFVQAGAAEVERVRNSPGNLL